MSSLREELEKKNQVTDRFFLLLTRDLSPKERKELSHHFSKIVEFTDLYSEKTHINELPEFDLLLLDLRHKNDHGFLELIVDELKSFPHIHVVVLKKKYCFEWQALLDVLDHTVINEVPLDVSTHEAFVRHLKKKKLKKVDSRFKIFLKKTLPFLVCS